MTVDRLARVIEHLGGSTPIAVDDPARRHAAVALILAPEPDRLLLVRRVVRVGDPWSGQLALPGGRHEPGDPDLVHTAIRETEEEVGFRLSPEQLRLALDDLAPMSPVLPPIVVRPYLFHVAEAGPLRTSDEVDHAEWLPLAVLADPAIRRGADLTLGGAVVRVIGYHLPIGLLWGMTERIVTPVVEAWRAAG